MAFIKLLWKGDVQLWVAFWVFGVGGWVVLPYFVDWFQTVIISSFPSFGIQTVPVISALWFAFTVLVWVAIWRSAGRFQGSRVWSYGARLSVVSTLVLSVWGIFVAVTSDTNDPGKDSSNIKNFLHHDDAYPWVGFWKVSCSEDFGLAVNKVEDGHYSVSFCGPGGCFKPGTYRPHTKLIGDDQYKLVDNDTIEVKGMDGFLRYHRCEM